MEIDKKIIHRLIQVIEDLKKSLKGIDIQENETVEIPHSLHALMTLTAISPRLAINIFLNITQEL